MKFGKLEDISNVDFRLPITHPKSIPVLEDKYKTNELKIFTGATSWNNDLWKDRLFPAGTKKKDYLKTYAQQFNSIELNATHYRTPSDKSITQWYKETPDDFRFCPKILQAISHRNDMLSNKELVNDFIVQLSKLDDKLGCAFIQLPPYFTHKNLKYLDAFLSNWPKEIRISVEVRDEAIFKNKNEFQDYIEILNKHQAIPCITDVSGRRDLLHMYINSKTVFIRWVGNGLHPTDYKRLKDWISRIDEWRLRGVSNIYFMLHEPENDKVPEIASFFASELKNKPYIEHRGPKLIEQTPNLFSNI